MSKKSNTAEKPLTDRIAKARREGRTQQALELANELVKHEPTDAHRELQRQVTLERGQQLHSEGKNRDATTVYTNALVKGGPPEYLAIVIQRLAACGAIALALASMAPIVDPVQRQRILQSAADAAVAQGPASKAALPADLHASFDLLLQAFAHYEAGRDEEARVALQGIGLQSPFLEWKVFLRGLLAYCAQDNSRALENWQRLDPARLPSRLSAALRASIDPAFLAAQPDATQHALRNKMLQQQGVVIAPLLRDLREMLSSDKLAPAFRKAESIVPVLKHDHSDLAARFALCFYWAIVDHGEPEDVQRFARVFGGPADDPQLFRLEALALETRGMWPESHKTWQDFIGAVAKNPVAWPGESGPRVQALIWHRMAENAVNGEPGGLAAHPIFGRLAAPTAAIKPTAEQCLEKAIKLAPDRLESSLALFVLYCHDDKSAKAMKVGQDLLKRFPDHALTMENLGQLCMKCKDYKSAQEYFEQAMQVNPLDRSLRVKLGRAKQNYALTLTLANKFAEARGQFEQALHLRDGVKTSLLCQWAIAEMKAKDPARATELIAQAQAQPDQRLACLYALVGESVRAKLHIADKKRIAKDLKDALTQTPTAAEILALLESAKQQRLTHDDAFVGQKTQEKTILKFLDSIKFSAFDETQLVRLCDGLGILEAFKPWLKCLNHARRHFLKNPLFRLSYADYYLRDKHEAKTHLAREHLDDARRLVGEMPRGEQQQQLLEKIKLRDEKIAEIDARNPSMSDVMDRIFGGFGADMGEDFDEDEEEGFW